MGRRDFRIRKFTSGEAAVDDGATGERLAFFQAYQDYTPEELADMFLKTLQGQYTNLYMPYMPKTTRRIRLWLRRVAGFANDRYAGTHWYLPPVSHPYVTWRTPKHWGFLIRLYWHQFKDRAWGKFWWRVSRICDALLDPNNYV